MKAKAKVLYAEMWEDERAGDVVSVDLVEWECNGYLNISVDRHLILSSRVDVGGEKVVSEDKLLLSMTNEAAIRLAIKTYDDLRAAHPANFAKQD